MATTERVWQELRDRRPALKIGGRWDWWEMDSQKWWEMEGWPRKQMGDGRLKPLLHSSGLHYLAAASKLHFDHHICPRIGIQSKVMGNSVGHLGTSAPCLLCYPHFGKERRQREQIYLLSKTNY